MSIRLLLLLPLALAAVSVSSAQDKPKAYKQDITGTKLSFEMQGIPGGEFLMGSKKGLYIRLK
jgi:sulfatase modifying factor 1